MLGFFMLVSTLSVLRIVEIVCICTHLNSHVHLILLTLQLQMEQFPGSDFVNTSLSADWFYVKSVGEIVGETPCQR
jgi:hypothetical protein